MKNMLVESLMEKMHISDELSLKFVTGAINLFKNEDYAPLACVLGALRGLAVRHQASHWQTMGKSFYADHLLFERIYNQTFEQVDGLAEKIVGLGTPGLVNPLKQLKVEYAFVDMVDQVTDNALPKKSLIAELYFIKIVVIAYGMLEEKDLGSHGIENMIDEIVDTHEGHVYLLKHRAG